MVMEVYIVSEIIDFCNRMCFETSWGSDVCKLIILLAFIELIFIFVKLLIKWRI